MQLMAPLTVLLAVECGYQWKVRRDPGLAVSQDEVATGSEDGIRYRTQAVGTNYCCSVYVTVLNVGSQPVTVRPYSADFTSEKCPATFSSVFFLQGSDVRDFDQIDQQVHARNMSSETPFWHEVRNPAELLEVPPNSFVSLTYFARGSFRNECGAYSFKLPVGRANVTTTFTEPK